MVIFINSSRSRSHDVEASTPSNVLENTSMKYLDNKIPKEANVAYMNYIWTINE
jgi:hypothetical protein